MVAIGLLLWKLSGSCWSFERLTNHKHTQPYSLTLSVTPSFVSIKAAYAKAYFFWTQYFDEEDGAVRGEDFHETALIHLGKKKCKTQHFYNLPPPKFVDAVMFAQWVKEGKIVF